MNTLMFKDRPPRRILQQAVFFVSLLFVSFSQGKAQIFDVAAEPPGMDTIQLPPGYRFDNTFRFGAIVSGADSLTFVWMKEIGLDYTYTYGGPSIEEFAELRDSSGWPGNEPDRWPVRRGAERWRHQAEIGVGAIYAPGYVEHSVPDAQALEMFYHNYYGHPYHDTATRRGMMGFGENSSDTMFNQTNSPRGKSADSLLHQATGYVAAGRFEACDTCGGSQPIARNGTWTNEILQTRDVGKAYERLGYEDSVDYFDLSFAIRVDEESILPDSIPASTVLAYAIAWRRDTIGQTLGTGPDRDACHCAFFVPVDTFYITKGMYLNSPALIRKDKDTNEQDYREFFFPFRFPTDTVLRTAASDTLLLIPLDTTVTVNGVNYSSIPVYGRCVKTDSLGNCIEWGARPNKPSDVDFGGGAKFGLENSWRRRFCDRLLDTLLARGIYPNVDSLAGKTVPEKNDFVWEFSTTNLVQIDFLMGRVSSHIYRLLQRGDLDSLITVNVEGVLNDTAMGDIMVKIAMPDEPNDVRYPGSALVASKVQRVITARDSTDLRGTFVNPKSLAYRYRIHTGDIDSTEVKINQFSVNQTYAISPQLPITYANPDMMSWQGTRDYYNMETKDEIVGGDTLRRRFIMGPNRKDYLYYTRVSQGFCNNVADRHRLDADVSRRRFRYLGAIPYPVGGIVQVHAFLYADPYCDSNGNCKGWSWARPITPEEITTQAWLALNYGLDGGLMFSDFTFCGTEFGVVNGLAFDDSTEYGELSRAPDPRWWKPGNVLPEMWLGFASRSGAVERIFEEFKQKILPVYTKLDLYGVETFSINRTPDSVAIPMLDMIRTEQAEYQTDSANIPTGIYDPRDSTFLEASIFHPTEADTAGYAQNALYVLMTNKRMYPKDFNTYSTSTLTLLDTLAIYDTAAADDYQTTGLGRIDFRRPVVVFKNNTDILADSAVIEMVGYETEWNVRVAYGDTVALDWIEPGWGAMYRVIPIPAFASEYGVAYNNAVRSENPSTSAETRDRLVVYERDSVVYLRSVDSLGAWSKEVMISNPDDAIIVDSQQVAANFFPALAVSRGGLGATRIVWERDSAGLRSVETAVISAPAPLSRPSVDNLDPKSDVIRHRLSVAAPLTGPPAMTPAIVSVLDSLGEAGFIVAWAEHDSGTAVMALHELVTTEYVAANDTTVIYDVYDIASGGDLICQYPTLANVSRFATVNAAVGEIGGTTAEVDSISSVVALVPEPPAHWRRYNLAHLAYQQGDGVDGLGERIYYHRLGVLFPYGQSPGLWVDTSEEVTGELLGCSFEHPSIAADSSRVGVAFEVLETNNQQRNIGLRFRDTVGVDLSNGRPLKEWQTTLYRWGGPLKVIFGMIRVASEYERPSLTQFPSVDSLTLAFQPEGGLTWFRRDGPTGRAYPQYLYRYGWFEPREVGDGKDPTLTLVPLVPVDPFAQTSIFHRSDDSSRVAGINDEGEDVWRYPARLLNTPGNPLPALFSGIPATGGIIANGQVAGSSSWCEVQFEMTWGLVFEHGSVKHPDDDRHVPGNPPQADETPGLPPTFFSGTGSGGTVVDELPKTEEIVRTGLFRVGSGPVTVRRVVSASDSIAVDLDGLPWDMERNTAANIWNVVEVVRRSDSVVLWRSDTITARGLDTLDEVVNEELEIPLHLLESSGTLVWCRMRTFASAGVPQQVSGGFTFYTDDQTVVGLPKEVSPWRHDHTEGRASNADGLQVRVIPNPARDRVEVRVRIAEGGEVEVSLWSLSGEPIALLPVIEASGAGEYVVQLAVESLPQGTYLLRAEMGTRTVVERFAVVR